MKGKMHIGGLSTLCPQSSLCSRVLLSVFLLAVPFLTSCGGGGSAAVNPPPPTPPSQPSGVAVTISPAVVTLPAAGTQTFTANVTGSSNVAVNWSVQNGSAYGSITSGGVYSAPNSPGLVCYVVATSQADSTKSATATITISPITMYVLPYAVNLAAGHVQTFAATVQGTTNTAVTWMVQEGASGGSITNAGVYTAPQSLGTFHVIATSQADSRISATAQINVVPIAVTIWPQVDILGPAGVRAFTATVTVSDQRVTWTIQEGASGGTITSTGLYTAPTQLGIYHVVATSVADATKSATATITVVQSGFRPTGGMAGRHNWHTATLLPNGKVLIVGDCQDDPDGGCFPTGDVGELYDPVSGTFSSTGRMATPRSDYTATLLPNGKVLIVGGASGANSAMAELFDPATGTFTGAGSMVFGRYAHTATLLPNGQVLIAGGYIATAEVYDPTTGLFTSTGSMRSTRVFHTATLLLNGTVLITGGFSGSTAVATAEIYDPATGLFTSTGSMGSARGAHTTTLLPNGTVIVAGGYGTSPLTTAEIYDPAAGFFTLLAGSMSSSRYFHTATLLPNGTVLFAGGYDSYLKAELYDPTTQSFMPTGSLEFARLGHTATLLQNGQVLIAGGDDYSMSTAELYK